MSNLTRVLGLCACCLCLTVGNAALADYTGLVHVTKADEETVDLCNNANGDFVAEPLDVCNVLASFDHPDDTLLSVGNVDITASNGFYFQHPSNLGDISPSCALVGAVQDLICDSFVTIGYKCSPSEPQDGTITDGEFDADEFNSDGHMVGGWFNAVPNNGQGDAGNDPPNQDLQVTLMQLSVPAGETITGTIDLFVEFNGEVFAFQNQVIECFVGSKCVPEDCDDGDRCTDDVCDPDTGCTNEDIECSEGHVCDPVSGECVEDEDPCECVNGKVTFCHIPPGNPARARTLTTNCDALEDHLAHGDHCGPCE